uniref:Uncharacterized protein n=1 Tax=Takifugu rubripes TaxID=31033 RepID=A0A3B5KEP6_TAKRU
RTTVDHLLMLLPAGCCTMSPRAFFTCRHRFQCPEGHRPWPAASVHAGEETRGQSHGPESTAGYGTCLDPADIRSHLW